MSAKTILIIARFQSPRKGDRRDVKGGLKDGGVSWGLATFSPFTTLATAAALESGTCHFCLPSLLFILLLACLTVPLWGEACLHTPAFLSFSALLGASDLSAPKRWTSVPVAGPGDARGGQSGSKRRGRLCTEAGVLSLPCSPSHSCAGPCLIFSPELPTASASSTSAWRGKPVLFH